MERYSEHCVRNVRTWRTFFVSLFISLTQTFCLSQYSTDDSLTFLVWIPRYVWIDWASIPQPSVSSLDTSTEKKEKLLIDQRNAINSISAYVERADFVVIVAPGCLHADRRDPETNLRTKTCYRTYRGRGWCVLEVFAAYLSRDKQFPSLLIKSKEGTPEWLSAMDTLNLAVGTSDYTCCQRNHVINSKVVSCDRDVTLDISRKMIHSL